MGIYESRVSFTDSNIISYEGILSIRFSAGSPNLQAGVNQVRNKNPKFGPLKTRV